jgi:hypothetical protein
LEHQVEVINKALPYPPDHPEPVEGSNAASIELSRHLMPGSKKSLLLNQLFGFPLLAQASACAVPVDGPGGMTIPKYNQEGTSGRLRQRVINTIKCH